MSEHICPQCHVSRWKTKVKNEKYECRECGYIKEVKKDENTNT